MANKHKGNLLGSWAFLIGLILAVLVGIFQMSGFGQGVSYLLIVLGIVVGLLNIADEEVEPFLMTGAVLVIVGTLGQSVVQTVPVFDRILQALTLLFVPATIIVALKNVFGMAKN
jgi:hypothetical protein